MHEETMQTERTRAHDARRVEKLFVLLIVSMGLSFAARACTASHSPTSRRQGQSRQPEWANRGRSKPSRLARHAKSLGQAREQIEAGRTGQSRQLDEQPLEQPWPRKCLLASW